MKITYEQAEPMMRKNIVEAERDLHTELERRNFINGAFLRLWEAKEQGETDKPTFIRLLNVLASFDQGRYNDYIDQLTGAATLGTLNFVIVQSQIEDLPKQARQRRAKITKMTGVPPIKPE